VAGDVYDELTMFGHGVRILRTRDVSSTTTTTAIGVALLALWLTGVVFTTLHHEYWRDEVQPLSLVRAAGSPFDLYGLIRYAGHPVLWYLLLFIGKSVVDTALILPIVSTAVALAAVVLFVWRSPFELWIKGLFIFGALPFYEYSVFARNYGISMLLLFVVALAYRQRFTRPLRLAVALALLANTNVHSALLTGLIAAIWGWEIVRNRQTVLRDRGLALVVSFFIVGLGLALCAAFTWPPHDTVIVSRDITAKDLVMAMLRVAVHPGAAFGELSPRFIPSWVTSVLLLTAAVGLARQPRFAVAALAAMMTLGALFSVVYPGGYRHQGLLLIFLVFLYWLELDVADDRSLPLGVEDAALPARRRRLLSFDLPVVLRNVGLHGAMTALMLAALALARYYAMTDLRLPMSSSKPLAEFLARSPYRDAILVAEPDYFAEALPYYMRNRMYFPRERRFGTTVTWTTASRERLTLSELVDEAGRLAREHDQVVLILLGHREVLDQSAGSKTFPYQKEFTWTQADRDHLAAITRRVADFSSAVSNENYSVHALLPANAGGSVAGASPARHQPQQPH